MSTAEPFDSSLTAPAPVAPAYIAPAPAPLPQTNGLGTAGMILGIIGATLMWVPFLGGVLGILATVFGSVGWYRANHGQASNRGMAIAGVVLGVVTIVFFPVMISAVFASAPALTP